MNSPRVSRVSIIASLFVAGGAAACLGLGGNDEESRRVELVSQLERSVAVVLVEGREISRDKKRVALEPSGGLGTGVVLSRDGLIVTASHVVAGAERIRVKLGEAEAVSARIVFSDDSADIALLRLAEVPSPLTPARLGDSDRVRKGETVYVIGNPVGIAYSLSTGVVSGRHTSEHLFGGSVMAEFVQTDAAINSGNSGGPIFNSRGEVIAIAQTIVSQGGGSQGLGFGLAINAVKKILGLDPCLWLGFSGVPLNDRWSALLNVSPGGLLVERVTPESPADQAGLRGGDVPVQVGSEYLLLGGDVVVKIDGLPVLEWARRPPPSGRKPGERHEARLTLVRAGRLMEVPVVTKHRAGW